jgi:hypothetical protein
VDKSDHGLIYRCNLDRVVFSGSVIRIVCQKWEDVWTGAAMV